MPNTKLIPFLQKLLNEVPSDWLKLTTHRLDIYNEHLAKTEFLEELETLFNNSDTETSKLANLPTAYDYIRLGHPLSSILEWGVAQLHNLQPEQVISFSSQTMPIFAVLRTNKLQSIKTRIVYTENLPGVFDVDTLKRVYGYDFELNKVQNV